MTKDLRLESGRRGYRYASGITRRLRRATALVLLGAMLMTLVEVIGLPGSQAVNPPTRVAIASSLGDAVRITAPALPSGLQPSQTDLAWSVSSIDGNGIGLGTNVADGSATPVSSIVNGVSNLTIGRSDTTAPPADTESHQLLNVSQGGFSLKTANSSSKSDLVPTSENNVVIASATTGGAVPVLSTSNLVGYAKANAVPTASGNPNATASANSHVTITGLNVGVLTLDVVVGDAKASATATGDAGSSTSLSCSPLKVTATVLGLLPVNIPITCGMAPIDVLGLGLISLVPGNTSNQSASPNSASAKITSLTIKLLGPLGGGVVIEAGKAEANASLEPIPPAGVCGATPPPASGVKGSAQGVTTYVTSQITSSGPIAVRADVSRSDAVIDEAGILGTGKGASADGRLARVQSFQPPGLYNLDGSLVPSHDDAPPNVAPVSNTVASVGPVLGTSATIINTTAAASTASDSTLSDPHASSSSTAATATSTNPLGLPITLSDKTVASTAQTDKVGSGVQSSGSSGVEDLSVTLAGTPIKVKALHSNSSAGATGSPGGATASATYDFLSVTIGATTITPLTPPPANPIAIGPLLVTFGKKSIVTDPGGKTASASMDALRIETTGPVSGLAKVVLVVGHSEAVADTTNVGGASGLICKDVDIHYDAQSFGDNGGTVAPHQKFNYRVCIVSTGATTLTGASFTDVLDPHLLVISLPPDVHQVGGTIESGQFYPSGGSLVLDPQDIPPGSSVCRVFLVEAKPDTQTTTVISNSATLTSTNGGGATSNIVVVVVGIDPNQPALFVTLNSLSFDSSTNILTANLTIHNTAGAGTAFSPAIESILANDGITVIPPLPTFPDIPGGGSIDFSVRFNVPPGVDHLLADVRETAKDALGRPYAFDSVPLNTTVARP